MDEPIIELLRRARANEDHDLSTKDFRELGIDVSEGYIFEMLAERNLVFKRKGTSHWVITNRSLTFLKQLDLIHQIKTKASHK